MKTSYVQCTHVDIEQIETYVLWLQNPFLGSSKSAWIERFWGSVWNIYKSQVDKPMCESGRVQNKREGWGLGKAGLCSAARRDFNSVSTQFIKTLRLSEKTCATAKGKPWAASLPPLPQFETWPLKIIHITCGLIKILQKTNISWLKSMSQLKSFF